MQESSKGVGKPDYLHPCTFAFALAFVFLIFICICIFCIFICICILSLGIWAGATAAYSHKLSPTVLPHHWTVNCIVLHCFALYYLVLHCFHCITLFYIVLHCFALYCSLTTVHPVLPHHWREHIVLHWPLPTIALHCVLHCAFHCIALHWNSAPYLWTPRCLSFFTLRRQSRSRWLH